MNPSKIIINFLCVIFAASHAATWASDAAELHRTNCLACHAKMTGGDGGVLYKRSDRIVNSKAELEQRVAHCAKGAHTNWSNTEMSAVADYLNELIYKFP